MYHAQGLIGLDRASVDQRLLPPMDDLASAVTIDTRE